MRFMFIATWEPDKRDAIVQRQAEKGHLLPEGIELVNQWVDISGGRVFRLVEASSLEAITAAIYAWNDLADIELVAVMETEPVMEIIQGA